MKKMKYLSAALCCFAFCGSSYGQGTMFDTNFTYEDIASSKIMVRAGAWFQDIDGEIIIDESQNDSLVDLNDNLGLEDNDGFNARLDFQPWQKHHIRLGYNGIEFDGDNTLNQQLIIDGQTYNANNQIVSDIQMDTYEVGYRYDWLRGDKYSLAPMIQVNIVDFDVAVNDVNQPNVSADEDVIVPLPMIGVRGEYFPHPRFGVFADVKGLTIGDTASAVDLEAGAQVNVFKNFSIVGGYRYMYFDFEISDSQGDVTVDGPFVAGQIQF